TAVTGPGTDGPHAACVAARGGRAAVVPDTRCLCHGDLPLSVAAVPPPAPGRRDSSWRGLLAVHIPAAPARLPLLSRTIYLGQGPLRRHRRRPGAWSPVAAGRPGG